jgi:hypothetical protein
MQENVPEMSLNTQTLQRLPKIKQGLREGLSRTQIGETCGVTEKTIDRDMQVWVQSGFFEVWLKTEFVGLYSHVVVANPVAAYKELAKIIAKMVTQKRELTVDETLTEKQVVEIDLSKLSDSDKQALDTAARILESQSKRELSNLH